MHKFSRILVLSSLFFNFSQITFAGVVYVGPTITYQNIQANDLVFDGLNPRITLGYGEYLRDYWYIAAEIFGGPWTKNLHTNNTDLGSLETKYTWGASILPGYIFDDTIMGFLRLGGVSSRFEDFNKVRSGIQYGVGIQVNICNPWNFRAEYARTNYRSLSGVGSPSANEVALSAIYGFKLA